ncbi:MAG: glycosyltransferase family 39 protein [Gaiellaceae bacterium]
MTASSQTIAAPRAGLQALRRGAAWLEDVRPLKVLSVLLVIEWLTILAVALTVQRNGWIYYQGGDQLWHYAGSWLMGHGRLTHTSVGYGWSIVLLPFALLSGPNLVSALPAILLFNVLVLMPIAFFCAYGIGERIGGRLFGYWTAVLWIVVPLVGIKYADAGYHQRYTELLLPQSFGLSVMSDFPSMVALAAAAYFTLRAAQDDAPIDAILAGLLAGVALGIKPSNAPFLAGAGLALLVARRWRGILAFGLGLAPGVVALAVWKARGEGQVPLFSNAAQANRVALGAHRPLVVGGLDLHRYIGFDWHWFTVQQLDSLDSHFWSVRVLEWLAFAGLIGLLRRSRPAGLLFGGWLFATIFVKWGSTSHGSTVDNSDILRQTIFTIPAALMLLSGVLLLFPGLPQRLPARDIRPWGSHRLRVGLATGLTTLFGVVPMALAVALPTLKNSDTLTYYTQTGTHLSAPLNVDAGWRATASQSDRRVRLAWPRLQPIGGTMNYVVLRAPASNAVACDVTGGGAQCRLLGDIVDYTNATSFDERVPPGRWEYWIGAKASWIDDPTAGDIFVASPPVVVTVKP